MSNFSKYLRNKMLDSTLRNIPYVSTAVYLALYTATPTESSAGTELLATGYTRLPISFGAPVDGIISNNADVTFPITTVSWGDIKGIGIFNALTGGDLLYYGDLTTTRTVTTGTQLIFQTGQLQITLS